ncbi:hypothetical protein [Pelosinus sp. UFO1]|nr:hypothetical protein [Pelosinus sp. UFO1]
MFCSIQVVTEPAAREPAIIAIMPYGSLRYCQYAPIQKRSCHIK